MYFSVGGVCFSGGRWCFSDGRRFCSCGGGMCFRGGGIGFRGGGVSFRSRRRSLGFSRRSGFIRCSRIWGHCPLVRWSYRVIFSTIVLGHRPHRLSKGKKKSEFFFSPNSESFVLWSDGHVGSFICPFMLEVDR